MITSWDDYSVRQIPMPVAHPASGDPGTLRAVLVQRLRHRRDDRGRLRMNLNPNLGGGRRPTDRTTLHTQMLSALRTADGRSG